MKDNESTNLLQTNNTTTPPKVIETNHNNNDTNNASIEDNSYLKEIDQVDNVEEIQTTYDRNKSLPIAADSDITNDMIKIAAANNNNEETISDNNINIRPIPLLITGNYQE
jgi:hypothetical protein